MSKYHGSQHFRGGFDVDESMLPEDASYWRRGAEAALLKINKIVMNTDKKLSLLDSIWTSNNSWKTICIGTEDVLKKLEEDQT